MIQADVDLSRLDRAIINAFQGGFFVVERPFELAAATLHKRGVDALATDLCGWVWTLDEEGVLSRFGAFVSAEEIDDTTTFVAMHAPPERFDEMAEQVNDHREVAHNCGHEYPHLNMWFVASVVDESRVEGVLGDIEDKTGQAMYNMPKHHEFHVDAEFLPNGPTSDGNLDLSHLDPDVEPTNTRTLTPNRHDLVMEVQGGLPVTKTSYADVAETIGQESAWVVEMAKRFNLEGKVRHVGVIPDHYALGCSESGTTVQNVPDNLVAEVGSEIASLNFVTHCYCRSRYEDVWSYNFFAMTHGRSEEKSEARIERVRGAVSDYQNVGDDDWDTLFSTHILKKAGTRLGERAEANME